jgi:hypothetical protein
MSGFVKVEERKKSDKERKKGIDERRDEQLASI